MRFIALIVCRSIQMHPEVFWSTLIDNVSWKSKMNWTNTHLWISCLIVSVSHSSAASQSTVELQKARLQNSTHKRTMFSLFPLWGSDFIFLMKWASPIHFYLQNIINSCRTERNRITCFQFSQNFYNECKLGHSKCVLLSVIVEKTSAKRSAWATASRK